MRVRQQSQVLLHSTPADGSYGKVVGGKMYVQVNAADTTNAMEGGQLYITGSTTPLVLQSVDIDGDGTTDVGFYVIDIGENGGTVDLTYTMPNGRKLYQVMYHLLLMQTYKKTMQMLKQSLSRVLWKFNGSIMV